MSNRLEAYHAVRLAALAIRPRPDPAAATFVDRVRELAEQHGADVGRLADALV